MNTTFTDTQAPALAASGVFSRILVGVDGSPGALEAARQAAILQDAWRLELLSAWKLPPHLIGVTGTHVPYYFDPEVERDRAARALAEAREEVAPYAPFLTPVTKVSRGVAWNELIRQAEQTEATLVAVGAKGLGRTRAILAGSTPTELIHKCPCSVLVARCATPEFPRRIVVGVDGSPESAVAYAAAREAAERCDADLRPVVATGANGVDVRLVDELVPRDEREQLHEPPVQALLAAAADADLIVVGSRGLRGLASLGSVSERVAHAARCSVLVVRAAPWQR
jgi:nucleotide-binding universal stress UspA family protein